MAADADTGAREVLNRGGWANGAVFLDHSGKQPAVIKSYAGKPLVIRLLGRYLLARERRAYRQLAGLNGIPRLIEGAGADELALEYVPGERISNRLLAEHGAAIIPRLTRLIEAMHGRGVYHLDLRNQGNILITPDHRPVLLDFASAVIIRGRNPVSRLLAGLCRRFDAYGLGKWRDRGGSQAGPRP